MVSFQPDSAKPVVLVGTEHRRSSGKAASVSPAHLGEAATDVSLDSAVQA